MGSFVRLSGRISAAALAGAALMAAPSAALAQPTVGASQTVNVPCSTSALAAAITQANFSGNTAGNGGAIANSAAATATISATLINNNTTTGVGGGGIINSGLLTLSGSTVNANTAPINGGGLNTQAAGITRIFQTTFTNNTSGSLGGGISNLGTTSLAGSQVRLNTGSAGGGIATGNNNITLTNTIVRDNTPDNCSPLNTIPGCSN